MHLCIPLCDYLIIRARKAYRTLYSSNLSLTRPKNTLASAQAVEGTSPQVFFSLCRQNKQKQSTTEHSMEAVSPSILLPCGIHRAESLEAKLSLFLTCSSRARGPAPPRPLSLHPLPIPVAAASGFTRRPTRSSLLPRAPRCWPQVGE
jgi:hypothetical protein